MFVPEVSSIGGWQPPHESGSDLQCFEGPGSFWGQNLLLKKPKEGVSFRAWVLL